MSLVGYGWTPVGWLMPRGLTREVSTYHGVDSAKGRVIGGGRDHEVVLAVVTTPAASLRDLHHTPTICCGRTVSRAGRPA